MNEITPQPRRIRSFFIKDILEHRNPPPSPTEEAENPTTPTGQSTQTTSTPYTVQHILGTNEERPIDPCSTGKRDIYIRSCIYRERYTVLYCILAAWVNLK